LAELRQVSPRRDSEGARAVPFERSGKDSAILMPVEYVRRAGSRRRWPQGAGLRHAERQEAMVYRYVRRWTTAKMACTMRPTCGEGAGPWTPSDDHRIALRRYRHGPSRSRGQCTSLNLDQCALPSMCRASRARKADRESRRQWPDQSYLRRCELHPAVHRDAHWRIGRSIVDGIRNQIPQHLLYSSAVPESVAVPHDIQLQSDSRYAARRSSISSVQTAPRSTSDGTTLMPRPRFDRLKSTRSSSKACRWAPLRISRPAASAEVPRMSWLPRRGRRWRRTPPISQECFPCRAEWSRPVAPYALFESLYRRTRTRAEGQALFRSTCFG